MQLEEARRKAYARGIEMKPSDPAVDVSGLFDQVDVADIIHECLDEVHPSSSMPSRRHDWQGYQLWEIDCEAIRAAVWNAFDAGTRGERLRELQPVAVH